MAEWSLRDAKNKFSAVVVVATEEYERLRRLEKSNAPTLGELLLEIPQDDEEFERLSLAGCPRRWGTTARTC